MTALGPLRARLAEQYVMENSGITVPPLGPGDVPVSPSLMHSYLQFLTLRRIGRFRDPDQDGIPLPIEWQRERVGEQLLRWADYTPSPYTSDRPHRGELWPWKGDIVVFDGGDLNPAGDLGIYLNHEGFGRSAVWEVFTQGPGPAAVRHVPVSTLLPVGWWQVHAHRLTERGHRSQRTTSIPTITEVETTA